MTDPVPSPPHLAREEQRVLAELERLQLAIRSARADHDAIPADAPPLRDTPWSAPPDVSNAPTASVEDRSSAAGPVRSDAAPLGLPAAVAPTVEPPPPRRSPLAVLASLAATVLVAAAALLWFSNRHPVEAPSVVAERPGGRPPVEEARQPISPPPPIQPADPHPLRVDLTTTRSVWVRVTVDGRVALEREVAGGEQLPFGADRAIGLRVGDAGAVTIRVGGIDHGALGGDGQVVTRTFETPVR